jgi:hypothetical protein
MEQADQFSVFTARLKRFFTLSLAANALREDEQFSQLACELFRLQHRFNPAYRTWCGFRGVTPDAVGSWRDIPALPVAAFKEMDVTCIPGPERIRMFRSSGTTAQSASRHFHSVASLEIYASACWPWFASHLLPAQKTLENPPSLLCLTPGPEEAPDSSLVYMLEVVRRKLNAPAHAFFGNVSSDGSWSLDIPRIANALEEAVTGTRPVYVLGTAFSFVHLLDHMEPRHLKFALPPGSRVMETGGYKGKSREMTRSELHRSLSALLGIPAGWIVSEYGMSELSSQAYDMVAGTSDVSMRLFRFPPWVRVRIISPETGREAGNGEIGLVQILDLANVYSVMALQTEDLGRNHGDGFELLGRAQAAEPRGCSLMLG